MSTKDFFDDDIFDDDILDDDIFDDDIFDIDDSLVRFGTSDRDVLIGKSDSEIIVGLEGNDILIGKDGNDALLGGKGNDSIISGRGNNLLLGNKGDDFLEISTIRLGQAGNNTLNGGAGEDTLNGGDGDDLLLGGTGTDEINGNEGNDRILGQKGLDFLFGDLGKDTIEGGDGDDSIEGGDGNDRLDGGKGEDTLIGGEGIDTLIGGKNDDIFVLIPNTGLDIIKDFRKGKDIFGLQFTPRFGKELTLEQLAITQGTKGATIKIAETGEVLALVEGVSADRIGIDDFIIEDFLSLRDLSQTLTETETNTTPVSPANETGLVVSQGVEVMKVDVARSRFGVDGSGITIGVISDSFDRSQTVITIARADILSGDIPGKDNPSGNNIPVTILDDNADNSDADGNLDDEGRGIIQLIHDVAPGSNFIFHSGFNSAEDFAQGIDELVSAGADIIVDDIGYLNEPFFQDGVIAQAADRAFAAGVPYFSAAGNDARNSYESEFRPVESNHQVDIAGLDNYHFHDFAPGRKVDVLQNFTLEPDSEIVLSFQWDNPFASAGGKGATSDLDIFLLDENNNIVAAGAQSNIGFDAVELLFFTNDSDTAAEYQLLIGQERTADGEAPSLIKYIDFAGSTESAEYNTFSSTIFGHPNANGAEAVGASFYQTPTEVEFFSSAGIIPILFDRNGDRLSEPEIRTKPGIIAPDGTNTTFFGFDDLEGDGFPNFFGTSAAAPHAAGVAALLLEAKPDASPELIYQVLQQTAIDLDDPFTPGEDIGFDVASGFGLIQADLALEALLT